MTLYFYISSPFRPFCVRTVLCLEVPRFQLLVLLIRLKVWNLSVWYLKSVAARYKASVCGRSLAGDCGFEPRRGTWMSLVCCRVEVSATGRSLVQRSTTECGALYCVWLGAKIILLYMQWVDRKRLTRGRKKERRNKQTNKQRTICKIKFLFHISRSLSPL